MKNWFAVIGFVVVALVVGVCVSCSDDDDDDSMPALVESHRRGGDQCRQDCRRSGDGDRKGNRYCFMPCDFTIIVPPVTSGGGDEQAALFPPSPEKLVQVIQAGAEAIGKSAGQMAGAIAALPVGILL